MRAASVSPQLICRRWTNGSVGLDMEPAFAPHPIAQPEPVDAVSTPDLRQRELHAFLQATKAANVDVQPVLGEQGGDLLGACAHAVLHVFLRLARYP